MKQLTSRATRSISSFIFLSLVTGCALFQSQPEEPVVKGPVTQVFLAPFDIVWRALQKSVAKYPIQTNNVEQGVIETEPIKGDDRWTPPHQSKENLPRYKYQLRFTLVRGKIKKDESVKLFVQKEITKDRDFFSGAKKMTSDGLEEKMLIYRVQRELDLETLAKKSFEKKQVIKDF